MEYLKRLIYKLFKYTSKITPREEGKGYYINFSNKIIGRYFKNIFDFPLGKKSDIVEAPELIKRSPFNIQKAFTRGLMQFDGSVKMKGTVAFSTNSKKLLEFFSNVIHRDGLKGCTWARKDRECELGFESQFPSSRHWLNYFIKGTLKYQKLYGYIYGFKKRVKSKEEAIKILERIFPPNNKSILPFYSVIKIASKLRKFTRYQISNQAGIHYKALSNTMKILERSKMVKIERGKLLERFTGKSDRITFNPNIRKWRMPLVED